MPLQQAALSYFYAAKLERVIDGDTVSVLIDVGFDVWIKQTVRLLGINAPETSTPEGKASQSWLAARLLPGADIYIQTTKDRTEKYGRLLGTIYPRVGKSQYNSENSFNSQLVAAGMAKPYDGGART